MIPAIVKVESKTEDKSLWAKSSSIEVNSEFIVLVNCTRRLIILLNNSVDKLFAAFDKDLNSFIVVVIFELTLSLDNSSFVLLL